MSRNYRSKLVTYAQKDQQEFDIPFDYIHTDHVKAFINQAAVSFTFLSKKRIQLSKKPKEDDIIVIERQTPSNVPLVDFQAGAPLLETDLDLQNKQLLYAFQELLDTCLYTLPYSEKIFFDIKALDKKHLIIRNNIKKALEAFVQTYNEIKPVKNDAQHIVRQYKTIRTQVADTMQKELSTLQTLRNELKEAKAVIEQLKVLKNAQK